MKNELEHILIFKTNIKEHADVQVVKELLDVHQHVAKWSIDTGDEDRVLRVVSTSPCAAEIINLINKKGYRCAELD